MIKVALCQTRVIDDKLANIENAYKKISEAALNGAKVVALGEMFNCPYSGRYFSKYAEDMATGSTIKMLREAGREHGVYIIGGSIPEISNEKIYNTSFVISPEGEIVAAHRKIHLFDINIENGIRFMESEYLSSGQSVTVFDTPYGLIGLCICYDIRFPELVRSMVLMGASMVFVPAAFNMTTGPAHWNILFRARALDNQVFMMGISPARNYEADYTAYGHTIAVDSWGNILYEAGDAEEIVYAQLDLEHQNKVRSELPLLKHRRPEIYII